MRRLIDIAIIGVLVLAGFSAARADDPTLDQAFQLARKGEVDQAIQLLLPELAKQNAPERLLSIHGLLGDLYSSQQEVDKAVAQYDAIIKIVPQHGLAFFRKGEALKSRLTLASQEAAIAAFQESNRLGYDRSEVFSNIGFCYKCLSDFGLVHGAKRQDCLRRAQENLEHALAMDPKSYHALYHLADLEFNMGQFKDATAKYQRMSELRPQDPAPLVRMGHAMYRRGDAQAALDPLDRAMKQIAAGKNSAGWERNLPLREIDVDCHLYRAEILKSLSRKDEAAKEYQTVLDLTDPTKQKSVTKKMESCRKRASDMLAEEKR